MMFTLCKDKSIWFFFLIHFFILKKSENTYWYCCAKEWGRLNIYNSIYVTNLGTLDESDTLYINLCRMARCIVGKSWQVLLTSDQSSCFTFSKKYLHYCISILRWEREIFFTKVKRSQSEYGIWQSHSK